MDELTFVNMDSWERADFYRQYTEIWGSIYGNATKKMDITATVKLCKEKSIKLVPAFLYCVARAINDQQCFRYWMHEKKLCYWNVLHPMFTTSHSNGTITYQAARFDINFQNFYRNYLEGREKNKEQMGLFANDLPENVFSVSVLPNFDFDSCSFSMGASKHRFMPICVIGKFSGVEKILMPVSLTICHAVVNGSEVGAFFNTLQALFAAPQEWLEF